VIPRYTPPAIAEIFSDETRLRRWLDVELLVCEGWVREGRVPDDALTALRAVSIDAARIAELEAEQGHDMAAFVSAVQERAGEAGRFIHLGVTSSDIVDTALATQLRDAASLLDRDTAALEAALVEQAERHRTTVMMGRTHGVHAEPLTLGIKLANFVDEVRRGRRRLAEAAREVAVGKITGTVGTHATVPPAVEEHVCSRLGLGVAAVSTQVVARDRHAAFVSAQALLGGALERLATTIRLLQVSEVDEVEEPFAERQKGSSAMPHKRNPVLCERICGLARLLRGYAATALEDIALWHERDISHSSAERVLLPDACAVTDYSLQLATRVVSGLRVNPARMLEHVQADGGIVFSQMVLTALIVEAGWSRERAYRSVQALAARAREDGAGFRSLVETDADVSAALGAERIARCFDLGTYRAGIDETYRRLGLSLAAQPAERDQAVRTLAVEAGIGGGGR
jgi:adenylosuccinate lyase